MKAGTLSVLFSIIFPPCYTVSSTLEKYFLNEWMNEDSRILCKINISALVTKMCTILPLQNQDLIKEEVRSISKVGWSGSKLTHVIREQCWGWGGTIKKIVWKNECRLYLYCLLLDSANSAKATAFQVTTSKDFSFPSSPACDCFSKYENAVLESQKT